MRNSQKRIKPKNQLVMTSVPNCSSQNVPKLEFLVKTDYKKIFDTCTQKQDLPLIATKERNIKKTAKSFIFSLNTRTHYINTCIRVS